MNMAADNGTLTITLDVKLNSEDAERLRKELEEIYGKPIKIKFDTSDAYTSGEYADNKKTGREATEGAASLKDAFKSYIKDENNQRKLITKGIQQSEKAITTSLTKGFGIVEDIYARLKAASPLLQTIESLFNLAMTLFFMPLGNKLGEVLIPATVELLDNVVKMWDAFEGKTLGEMFSIAISQGVKLFGAYFNDIGGLLKEQGGLLGGIGNLIQTIGSFIEGPGVTILNSILNVTNFIVGHIREFISLWIAMKTAEIAMEATGWLGDIGAKVPIAAAAAAVLGSATIAGVGSYVGTSLMMADGGYVPAKPGGSLRVLGEGGKGEYVIPEDRMGKMGGNVTINVYGYTDSELKTIIRDTVNEQVSQSRIRGSF